MNNEYNTMILITKHISCKNEMMTDLIRPFYIITVRLKINNIKMVLQGKQKSTQGKCSYQTEVKNLLDSVYSNVVQHISRMGCISMIVS